MPIRITLDLARVWGSQDSKGLITQGNKAKKEIRKMITGTFHDVSLEDVLITLDSIS